MARKARSPSDLELLCRGLDSTSAGGTAFLDGLPGVGGLLLPCCPSTPLGPLAARPLVVDGPVADGLLLLLFPLLWLGPAAALLVEEEACS